MNAAIAVSSPISAESATIFDALTTGRGLASIHRVQKRATTDLNGHQICCYV